MGKHDILIVDDEKVIIDAVEKICTGEGMTVDTSIDPRSALHKLEQSLYRLIICDIMMPEIDGFQFLEILGTMNVTTPLIMATGYSTLENAVRSLTVGAIDFIPKPFTAEELLSSIRRGLKYAEIKKQYETMKQKAQDVLPMFIPCPGTYYRLGYRSWGLPDHSGLWQVGTTDLFLRTLGNIRDISLARRNDEVFQGEPCARIISDDGLEHPIIATLSGKVIDVHQELLSDIHIIEKDPYFKGWIYRVLPSELEYEIKNMMTGTVDYL